MTDENVVEGTENEQTGQDVGENPEEVIGAEEVDAKPRKAKSKSRRTVRSVMRIAMPNAPANLLEMIENFLVANSVEDLASIEDNELTTRRVNAAFNRYTNHVLGDPEILTKSMEEGLREYAESSNIDYGSMFTHRGSAVLNEAIRIASGYNGIQSIIDAAS